MAAHHPGHKCAVFGNRSPSRHDCNGIFVQTRKQNLTHKRLERLHTHTYAHTCTRRSWTINQSVGVIVKFRATAQHI